MPVLNCPHCALRLEAPDDAAPIGSEHPCPQCGGRFRVPEPGMAVSFATLPPPAPVSAIAQPPPVPAAPPTLSALMPQPPPTFEALLALQTPTPDASVPQPPPPPNTPLSLGALIPQAPPTFETLLALPTPTPDASVPQPPPVPQAFPPPPPSAQVLPVMPADATVPAWAKQEQEYDAMLRRNRTWARWATAISFAVLAVALCVTAALGHPKYERPDFAAALMQAGWFQLMEFAAAMLLAGAYAGLMWAVAGKKFRPTVYSMYFYLVVLGPLVILVMPWLSSHTPFTFRPRGHDAQAAAKQAPGPAAASPKPVVDGSQVKATLDWTKRYESLVRGYAEDEEKFLPKLLNYPRIAADKGDVESRALLQQWSDAMVLRRKELDALVDHAPVGLAESGLLPTAKALAAAQTKAQTHPMDQLTENYGLLIDCCSLIVFHLRDCPGGWRYEGEKVIFADPGSQDGFQRLQERLKFGKLAVQGLIQRVVAGLEQKPANAGGSRPDEGKESTKPEKPNNGVLWRDDSPQGIPPAPTDFGPPGSPIDLRQA